MNRALLVTAVVLLARGANAVEPTPEEEKRVCFRAVDEAQRLRVVHKLAAARDEFIQCARPVCPALFRNDCVTWLAEVQAALPSVVFGAKDAQGQDLIHVRVLVDGNPVTESLEGTSKDVDPGPHVFRFEWDGHGMVEQQAVIHEGEKDRLISVSFPLVPQQPRSDTAVAPPVPVGVWILGGVAVAGLLGFTGLFVSTESDVNNLRASGCAPNCDVTGAHTKLDLAYASLGIGIAAAAVGTTWFIVSRGHQGQGAALSVGPTWGGGSASFLLSY